MTHPAPALNQRHGRVPVAVACRVLKLHRQHYYAWLAEPVTDAEWVQAHRANAIFDAHRDDPEFGYRFLVDEARDAGGTWPQRDFVRARDWTIDPAGPTVARLGVTSFDQFYVSRIGVFSRLRQHGVAVVTGVDSGMAPPKRHGNAWRTVGELVEAGYPVAEALAAATSVAADACGLERETGRLAARYAADLMVVDGDLAQDVSVLSAPQAVLIRGIPVDLT